MIVLEEKSHLLIVMTFEKQGLLRIDTWRTAP
jgi:hypothetical protein